MDCSVKVVAAESANLLESTTVHCEPIIALALSSDGHTLATGSRDCTVILWKVHYSSTTTKSENTESQISAPAGQQDPSLAAMATASGISSGTKSIPGSTSLGSSAPTLSFGGFEETPKLEGPIHVLRGHLSEVISVAVCGDLDTVASSSLSRGVLLHSIASGRFQRTLPGVDRADLLEISPEGLIVTWDSNSRLLRVFNLNGRFIVGKTIPQSDGKVSTFALSSDGLHLIVGTSMSSFMPSGGEEMGSIEGSWREGWGEEWVGGAGVTVLEIYTLKVRN